MRKLISFAFISLVIITGSITSSNTYASLPPNAIISNQPSLAPMLQRVMPTVVNVAAQGEMIVPISPHMSKRPQSPAAPDDDNNESRLSPYGALREFASLGSGVIVDAAKGYILTNAHVISQAKTITVTLSDGRSFKAKLIGNDPASDIAVIQIQADKLMAMPLGDSDKLNVGDFVVAIGNPFGLNQTVTSGIISALKRGQLGIEGPQGLENFIQTDASINPGNSGGALINMQGQLIGINTAILAPDGGNIGIGFAIPINMAHTIMGQLIEYGSVKRGLMGVIVQDLTPDLAKGFKLSGDTNGAIVTQVSPNSPAQKAGLQPGDIIQEVNGTKVSNASAVRNAVGLLRVKARLEVKLLRQGKMITVELTTADPERYLADAEAQNPFLFGLALRNFDEQTPLQGHLTGVIVMHVSKNSAAWRAGLIRGDVIVSANQIPVKSVIELEQAAAQDKKHLLLNVVRGNGALFVILE